MGSGKTHWGRRLGEKLNIPFYDLDEQIVNSQEKTIAEIFAQLGEEQFRLLEKDTLHLITESHPSFVMACGGGTPCFYNNIDYMKSKGTVVWINTNPEKLFHRLLSEKDKRPLIRELTDEQLRGFIFKKIGDRRIYYRQANMIVDEEEPELDSLIKNIFHAE